jgi:hypothetical protein
MSFTNMPRSDFRLAKSDYALTGREIFEPLLPSILSALAIVVCSRTHSYDL